MDVLAGASASFSPNEIQQTIYAKMTPAQKWQEVLRLRDVAWQMKGAFLRKQNPSWSEQEIQTELKKIFLYAST
jgi:hypothetical protein